MIAILIIVGAILIIIRIARKSNKKNVGKLMPTKMQNPGELVNIETTRSGNTTTFSVKLNENELKRRLENGTLSISEKREDPVISSTSTDNKENRRMVALLFCPLIVMSSMGKIKMVNWHC